MDLHDLGRLQRHYERMTDDDLRVALFWGPDAYRSSEVWKIIVEEAGRRGLAVPTQRELDEHEAAGLAEERAARVVLPWRWRLYVVLTRVVLGLTGIYYLKRLVWLQYDSRHYAGWGADVNHARTGVGLVLLLGLVRHYHVVAIVRRFRNPRA